MNHQMFPFLSPFSSILSIFLFCSLSLYAPPNNWYLNNPAADTNANVDERR